MGCATRSCTTILLGLLVATAIDSRTRSADAATIPELPVETWRILGTGKADATPQSINPPDALAFTSDGLLLATDAMNHRVQIFDPVSGAHLGSFGDADLFPGEVVGIAVAPDGSVFVSDEKANQIRLFARADCGNALFIPAGPSLSNSKFQRITGVVCDSAGRLYAVDTLAGEVYRYLHNFVADPTWKFESRRPDGVTMLHRTDGITIDDKSSTLFVTSERNGMVYAYDCETGRFLGRTIGRHIDPASVKPIGESVFSRSVEGLAILDDYLLAVDEGDDEETTDRKGQLLVFPLRNPTTAGPIGRLGDFRSPDGVATFTGSTQRPESLVAVADQGRFRVVLFRGDDLLRAVRSISTSAAP